MSALENRKKKREAEWLQRKKVGVLKETKGKRGLLVVVVVTSEVKRGRLRV
jgi:hypothetical protein